MSISESFQYSVRNTLAYFDLVDFPLTKEDLFAYLWQPPQITYAEFLSLLPVLQLPEKDGYYFLPGREEIIQIRARRLLISEKKLTIARRAARLIRSVPFLKAIFVCNTVATEQATTDSDIDFFIITAKNRIWITRLLITIILQLFGLRRRKNKIKDKICLSFYVTEDNLDLSKLRVIDDDIHFAFWINQMLPLFDPQHYYPAFLQANAWTKKYLPHINPFSLSLYIDQVNESRCSKIWKKVWEALWSKGYGDLINNEAKKIQLSKISRSQSLLKSTKFSDNKSERNDKGVVISDTILKFHEKDTRLEYRQRWQNRVAKIIGI